MSAQTYFGHPIIDFRDVPNGVITNPGIYSNVPLEIYHKSKTLFGDLPSVSSSHLRFLEEPDGSGTLEKLWDKYHLNPDAAPSEESAEMIFGRAVHLLFGGEEGFSKQFVIRPDTYLHEKEGLKKWNGNANVCQALLAQWERDGLNVLTGDDVVNIQGMAKRLSQDPFVKSGGLSGLIEHSIFWYEDVEVLGPLEQVTTVRVWKKSRPDALPLDAPMYADLKTASDASPLGARKAIGDRGYHQQFALVHEGIKNVTGITIEDHVAVFQEKRRPWSVNVKPLEAWALDYGHRQNKRALQKFAWAWANQFWPGFEDSEVPAGLPEWLAKRLATQSEDGTLPK